MDRFGNMISGIMAGIILFLLICISLLIYIYHRQLRRTKKLRVSDHLTGGLNSAGFFQAASKYFPRQYSQYTIVMMDIRNFRQLRQTFGISDSDRVLIHLYRILKSHLSGAEPIARTGSHTFYFLLKNRQEDDIRARLLRISESANSYNQNLQIPYHLDLQFGIYIPRTNVESCEEMMEKAARSLDEASAQTLCCFYKSLPGESYRRKWEMIQQMDHSLKNGEFTVYLQPKVRLSDKRIVGAEALIRWRHPQRGLLTPEMFIPLLEEYHMIRRLDLFLFETVCQKLAEWDQAGWSPCPVSVNLSCHDTDFPEFLDSCAALTRKYDVKPVWIEFELNLTDQLPPIETLRSLIDRIHSYGFLCSLDHFGAGSIPLYLLRELETDIIKLDRSLFSSENNSRRNRFVVEALLKIATQMQIHTVAEGIDNASQIQYLQQAGCDLVQGFFYFRPMPMDDFQKTVYQNGDLRYVVASNTADVQAVQPAVLQSAANRNIVMFSYLVSEDRILFSDVFSPLQNGQLAISNALSLFERSEFIHENDRKDFFHLLDRCRKEDRWVENALRFYTSEGRYEWLEVHLHQEPLPSNSGIVITGTLVNIAEWKKQVRHWKEKANRDALTGLYNRQYFEQYISNALQTRSVFASAMVFIDVDNFKNVNDTLGHVIGDDVLCFIAKRLLGVFRHTDIVARYAGDEFVVFVNGIDRSSLESRLTQLCDSFRSPYRNGSIEYPVSGSIGASMYPEDGNTYQELLNHADSAAYAAKRSGKNKFVFYQPGMEEMIPDDQA